VQAQTWGASKECHHRQCATSPPNPVAGCVHWIVALPELGGQLLDLGMPYFFLTIWACNLQRQGHPLLWFDETRSMGLVEQVHVGRQARTATGHGHLEG
jgi:hypothetical protein